MHKPSASVCLGIVLEKKWDGDSAVTLKPVAAVSPAPAKGSTLQSKVYSTTTAPTAGDGYCFLTQKTAHATCHVTKAMEHRRGSPHQEGLMGSQSAPVSSEARARSGSLSWAQLSSNKMRGGHCPLLQGRPLVCTRAAGCLHRYCEAEPQLRINTLPETA